MLVSLSYGTFPSFFLALSLRAPLLESGKYRAALRRRFCDGCFCFLESDTEARRKNSRLDVAKLPVLLLMPVPRKL